MKLSDLKTARQVEEEETPAVKRMLARGRVAQAVAIQVIRYRVENGLSIEQLAKKLGVSPKTVLELESGHRRLSISLLSRLSRVLGLSFDVHFTPDAMSLEHVERIDR